MIAVMNKDERPLIGDPDCHFCHGNARGCDCACVMGKWSIEEADRRERRRAEKGGYTHKSAVLDADMFTRERVLEAVDWPTSGDADGHQIAEAIDRAVESRLLLICEDRGWMRESAALHGLRVETDGSRKRIVINDRAVTGWFAARLGVHPHEAVHIVEEP